MIKVINESFKNFPSWLKTYLSHNRYVKNEISKMNVDLANADIEEIDSSRNPKLKDPDYIVFVNLASSLYNRHGLESGEGVCIYKPTVGGKYKVISDVYIDGKYASKMSNKALLNIADNFAVLSISQNKKPNKDRYRDPRKSYKGWDDNKGTYAGQTYKQHYSSDPSWDTPSGRDKSGYIIPDPAKLVGKLYEFNLDTAADTLDNYYKKLTRIKNRIFSLDVRSLGDDYSDMYDTILRYFGRASQDFLKLEKEINQTLSKVGSDKWNKEMSERGMTSEELFQEYMQYLYNKRDLDDYIKDIQSRLKKLENV